MFQDHVYAAIDLNCYKFMDHRSELSDTITQIINTLLAIQTASQENQYALQIYLLLLKVLAETFLASVDIPLEVVVRSLIRGQMPMSHKHFYARSSTV